MDYARVLLTVLWDDFCFLLMGVVMMAALLIPASFMILVTLGRVYDGVPFRIQVSGTLYGWFSGVVTFVGLFLLATILKPSIHWTHDALAAVSGLSFILYIFVTVVAAAQALQYVEHHYNRREEARPRQRFAFTLRTFVIGQVVLCVLIGWWVSSRREVFARQYERVQLRQYEAAAEKRFGPYGWSTRVLMPSYGQGEKGLELFLFDNQDLDQFNDDVLKQFQPADGVRLLQVNSPNLTDEGLATIGKLHSLRRLSLRSNQITAAGLAHLKQLPRLNELAIESDRLTIEGLQQLKQFPALQRLSVVGDMGSSLDLSLSLSPDVEFNYDRRLK